MVVVLVVVVAAVRRAVALLQADSQASASQVAAPAQKQIFMSSRNAFLEETFR